MTGDDARPHSIECGARLQELMREDDVEAEIIARRHDRREQRAKVIAERNKAKDEEGSEPRTAPQPASNSSNGQQEQQVEANNAKRKSDDTEEPGETRSKKQKVACWSGRAKTKEFAKSVLEQLIAEEDISIRTPSTHEVVAGIIDQCTRKVMEELSKTDAAESGCSVDITKANSSLPMAKMAATLGYKSGFVLDLTTEDENGKKWDFSDLKTQNEAEEKLREESPWLLAPSLPSTVFATTQSLNFSNKLMERRRVTAHISFAVKLCVMQSKSGRKFMIEKPVGSRAWGTQLVNKLLFEKGVGKVNFDFGMFEMKSAKEREVRLARKRTSIISNSQALLKELAKYQTSGRHQHVTTLEWKTTACHMYNSEFCKTVCETIMKEKNNLDNTSGVLGRLSLGPSEAQGHHRNDQ